MAAVPLQVPSRNAERVPEAAHLACDVVIDAFGHDSGLVAKFLLRRGNRTLRELTRDTVRDAVRPRLTARAHHRVPVRSRARAVPRRASSPHPADLETAPLLSSRPASRAQGLKPSRCQQVLMVLIHHNCVAPLRGGTPDSDALYHIHVDNILHRLRYPRFLLHTRERMGETHEALLEGLLEHGRLRARALFERAEASSSGLRGRRRREPEGRSRAGGPARRRRSRIWWKGVSWSASPWGGDAASADEDDEMDGEADVDAADGSPPPSRAAASATTPARLGRSGPPRAATAAGSARRTTFGA